MIKETTSTVCKEFKTKDSSKMPLCNNCVNSKRGYICENGLAVEGCFICTLHRKAIKAQVERNNIYFKRTLKYADDSEEWEIE